MKPNFALSLSFDSISLLRRAETGWSVLGDVSFQKDDLTPKISRLRQQALRLDPSAAQVKLVIPNEQIKYLTLARPKNALIDDIEALINNRLKTATPYQLSELRFDWATTQDRIFVAAVAIETLQEAEAFAQSCEFKPLGNVAIPPKDSFIGEVFFGTAEGDRRRMECDEQAIVILPNPKLIAAPAPTQTGQKPVAENPPETTADTLCNAQEADHDLVFRSQRNGAKPVEEYDPATASPPQTLIAPQVTLDPKYAASLMVSAPINIGKNAAKRLSHEFKSALQRTRLGLHSLRQLIINHIRSIDLSGPRRAVQQIKQELAKQANTIKQYRGELANQQQHLRRQWLTFLAKSQGDIKTWWQETQKTLELPEDLKRTIKPFWPVLLVAPVILAAVAIAAYSVYDSQITDRTNQLAAGKRDPDIISKAEVATLKTPPVEIKNLANPLQIPVDIPPKIAKLNPLLAPAQIALANSPSKPATVNIDDSFELDLSALNRLAPVEYFLAVDLLDEPTVGALKSPRVFNWQTLPSFERAAELASIEKPPGKPIGPVQPDGLSSLKQTMPEWPAAPMPPSAMRSDRFGTIYTAVRDPSVLGKDVTALPDSANLRPEGDFLMPFLGLSSHNPTIGHDTAALLRSIPIAPTPPADMGWDYLGDIYIASIDPPVEVYDAIALPDISNLTPEPNFIRPLDLSFATAALSLDDLKVVEKLSNSSATEDKIDDLSLRANTNSDATIVPQEVATLDARDLNPETQIPLDPALRTPLLTEVDLLADGSSPPEAQTLTTSDEAEVALLKPEVHSSPFIPDRPNMVPEPSAEDVPLLTVTGIPLVTVRPPQRPSSLKSPDQKEQEALAALAVLRPKVRPAEAVAAIKPLPFEQPLLASLRPKSRPLDLETTQGISFLSRLISTISEGDEAEVGSGAGTEPSNALVRKQATLKGALNLRRINLIGVFGTKSTRRALIRLKSGRRVMVEVGDRLDGGRVAAIAKNELRYIKSGENITLSLPRG